MAHNPLILLFLQAINAGTIREAKLNIPILAIVWILAWLMVDPMRNFPLNDDWSYSMSVKVLVEEGRFFLHDWLGVPLFSQILWGSLFCMPFGFSFMALTVSTLSAGLAGIIFSYLTILRISRDTVLSFGAALLIAFNPLFFSLSETFMTDIPFYALFMAVIYLYVLHLQEKKHKYWALGTLFMVTAMLLRQIAVILPLAFTLYILVSRSPYRKKQLVLYSAALVIAVAVYELYGWMLGWLGLQAGPFRQLSEVFTTNLTDLGWRVFTRTGLMLLQAGLWLFPLVLYWFVTQLGRIRNNYKVLMTPVILLLFPMIRMYHAIPGENILFDLGLGPVTTVDVYIHGSTLTTFSVPWIWHIIRPVSFTGGIMIIALAALKVIDWFRSEREGCLRDNTDSSMLWAMIILVSQVPMMINFTYFDRYILPLFIPVILLTYPSRILPGANRLLKQITLPAFLLIIAWFSIAGTKNYIEWNRLRWHAAEVLIREGVSAGEIDGGHEFNGWNGAHIDKDGRWDVSDYDYAITFTELEGFAVMKRYDAYNYIKLNYYPVYMLERIH